MAYRRTAMALSSMMSIAWIDPSAAAAAPDNVAAQVREAARTCREMGGEPNTDAMLTARDLNGDGAEDWIVDYAKLKCAGTPNPFCGSAGCGLQIYLWSGGEKWKRVFDSPVQAFTFSQPDGHTVFKVKISGSECGKANAQSCPKTYRFQGGKLVQTH